MKKNKWLLLFIIGLPSFFWLILETSSINSHRLNYYGPKVVRGKDTVFYSVNDLFYKYDAKSDTLQPFTADIANYPLYVLFFERDEYRKDGYRMTGLNEYLQYKFEMIKHIPFLIVSKYESGKPSTEKELEKYSTFPNVKFLSLPGSKFEELNELYFKDKPYYVDKGFLAFIDEKRNIRGYYDSRFATEVKRLADEYKHLRLKNEKEKMIMQNEVERK